MKNFVTLFLLVVVCLSTVAQPTFNKNYKESDGNAGWAVLPTNNGYIVCGAGYSDLLNGWVAIKIFATDSSGNFLWLKTIGKENFGYYPGQRSFVRLHDGNYACAGAIVSSINQTTRSTILKISPVGDTIWVKNYGNTYFSGFYQVRETFDRGLIATGEQRSGTPGIKTIFLEKTDSSGNQEWLNTYGVVGYAQGYTVEQTPDSGFIIGARNGDGSQQQSMPMVIKTDKVGNVKWQANYARSAQNDCPGSVTQSRYSGYYLWGCIDTLGNSEKEYIYKLDSLGNVVWKHFFEAPLGSYLGQARELTDGSVILTGATTVPGTIHNGGWIVKLDSSGNQLWERIYPAKDTTNGNISVSFFYDFQVTRDNGLILTGAFLSDSGGISFQNFWLMKTDSMGCVGSDCGYTGLGEVNSSDAIDLRIYPNPGQSNVTISWQSQNPSQDATVYLFDLLGREVYHTKVQGINQAQISLIGFQQGIHIIKVVAGNEVITGKLLISQ